MKTSTSAVMAFAMMLGVVYAVARTLTPGGGFLLSASPPSSLGFLGGVGMAFSGSTGILTLMRIRICPNGVHTCRFVWDLDDIPPLQSWLGLCGFLMLVLSL